MRALKLTGGGLLVLAFAAWIANAYLVITAQRHIVMDPGQLPNDLDAIIVLGASVYRSGELSPVLRMRVDAALELAHTRPRVPMLFSGHSVPNGYNEPAAMAQYARLREVNSEFALDEAGASTYTSIFNAASRFGVRRAVIVSQLYHLPRAVFIARFLGMDAYGLPAPDTRSHRTWRMSSREFASRLKDFTLLQLFRMFRQPPTGDLPDPGLAGDSA